MVSRLSGKFRQRAQRVKPTGKRSARIVGSLAGAKRLEPLALLMIEKSARDSLNTLMLTFLEFFLYFFNVNNIESS